MARVRAIMMQKDEGDALARWLCHYCGLFGPKNLTVLDNGSQDKLTLSYLSAAERSGVTIFRQFDRPHDFHHKGGYFGNIIKSWDHDHRYDFALPVDCDEILAVFTDSGLSSAFEDVHREFERLLGTRRALRLDMTLFNVPERSGWFAPVRHFHKGFLPARSLRILDNGQHDPISRLEVGYRSTRFAYLHWHNLAYEETVRRAKIKLGSYVDPSDLNALSEYARRPGAPSSHAAAIVLRTREEYLRLYDDEVQVFTASPNSTSLIQAGETKFVWDSQRYLELHKDVAERYELTALHHYLRMGFTEGRQV